MKFGGSCRFAKARQVCLIAKNLRLPFVAFVKRSTREGNSWHIRRWLWQVFRFNDPPSVDCHPGCVEDAMEVAKRRNHPHSSTWLIPTRDLRYLQQSKWGVSSGMQESSLERVAAWSPRTLSVPVGNRQNPMCYRKLIEISIASRHNRQDTIDPVKARISLNKFLVKK